MAAKLVAKISILVLVMVLAFALKSKAGSIVIYWGQNVNEGTLQSLCDDAASRKYSIVNIAFLYKYGNFQTPAINLAGHCWDPICPTVAPDIVYCQNKGLKVFISIGGGTDTYTLVSDDDGRFLADYIWNNFLGGESTSRPFGDAVLDGVDFDIEHGEDHYAAVAERLLELSNGATKKMYLGAAPQCPFPDRMLNDALSKGYFDYVWIQFYNNPDCEYHTENPNGFKNSWMTWVSSISVKEFFFVGLPASSQAAGSGYVEPDVFINEVLPFVQTYPEYGGVMLWSRFFDLITGYSLLISPYVLENEKHISY